MVTQILIIFYKFFRTRFVKRLSTSREVHFLDDIITLNSYKFFHAGPNHGGEFSVPL